MNDFGPVQAVDHLGQRIVVGVAHCRRSRRRCRPTAKTEKDLQALLPWQQEQSLAVRFADLWSKVGETHTVRPRPFPLPAVPFTRAA